jgi:hypothetical protein
MEAVRTSETSVYFNVITRLKTLNNIYRFKIGPYIMYI